MRIVFLLIDLGFDHSLTIGALCSVSICNPSIFCEVQLAVAPRRRHGEISSIVTRYELLATTSGCGRFVDRHARIVRPDAEAPLVAADEVSLEIGYPNIVDALQHERLRHFLDPNVTTLGRQ